MTMRVRIIDNGDHKRRTEIEQSLKAQATELNVDLELVSDSSAFAEDELVVYLAVKGAAASHSASQIDAFTEHAEREGVLPVLDKPTDAPWLPEPLKPINALIAEQFGKQWPSAVVDEVLSRLYLRRRLRRVFISYRRVDSQGIARQLFDRLTKLGFEVFLDEVSIPPSVDFQRSLKAWLIDADMVIVLASPRFEESQWTTEEISFCGNANIGMLRVGWPDEVYGNPATHPFAGKAKRSRPSVEKTAGLADEHWDLTLGDLSVDSGSVSDALRDAPETITLTDSALEAMVGRALRARTKAIGQRLQILLELARTYLSEKGTVANGTALGDLIVDNDDGQQSFVRVVPFRPGPATLHRAWRDAQSYAAQAGTVGLYYSEFDATMESVVALKWLAGGQQPEPPSTTVVYADVGGKP